MARIRTIKPDFFQSEDVAVLSYRARLTWIGLWTHVDDEGRCKANPRLIKGALWPLEDDVTASHVEGDVLELQRQGKIQIYEIGGERYIQILNWLKHQKISRPSESKLPPPPQPLTEDSLNPHGGITEPRNEKSQNHAEVRSSLNPHGGLAESSALEVEVEVEQGSGGGKARGRAGTTLPPNFAVTPQMHAWAIQHAPNVNVQTSTHKFRSHYRSVAGPQQYKTDWTAAWEAWILGDQQRISESGHLSSSERRLQHAAHVAQRVAARQPQSNPFEGRELEQ